MIKLPAPIGLQTVICLSFKKINVCGYVAVFSTTTSWNPINDPLQMTIWLKYIAQSANRDGLEVGNPVERIYGDWNRAYPE